LAFKIFPDHFPTSDRLLLSTLTELAIRRSNNIIAVSENTKKDILRFYPMVSESKVHVIYHGFDPEFSFSTRAETVLSACGVPILRGGEEGIQYILYVGALQPRKNLITLIRAFERLKKDSRYTGLKLVLAGERAWLWKDIERVIAKSIYKESIVITGTLPFVDVQKLYAYASVFVFPSLYGLPILEAFAARVPVVCARNSSLPEVAGDGALYFSATEAKQSMHSADELSAQIQKVLEDDQLREELTQKGTKQLKKFSWDTCARKTLKVIKK